MNWIQFEFSKVKYYRFFWALTLGYVLVLLGVGKVSNISINGAQPLSENSFLFWAATYLSQIYFGYLATVLICNEFETRTLKQHINNGLGRLESFFSRLLFFGLLIGLATALVFAIGFLTGNSSQEAVPKMTSFIEAGNLALRTLAFVSVAFLFSTVFKKSNTALALYFSWPTVLEPLLGWLFKKYEIPLYKWLPATVLGELVKSPFGFGDLAQTAGSIGYGVYVATAFYILFFWLCTTVLFLKTDL